MGERLLGTSGAFRVVHGVRIAAVQLRASLLLALQYRYDFLIDALLELFATAAIIVPLVVVYSARAAVAGVHLDEALVVVGFFTVLQGIVEGAMLPSLAAVVAQVHDGTLDFVLLRPADAQLLVSTSRFHPWKLANVVAGLAVICVALGRLGRTPSLLDAVSAVLVFICGVVILYSLTLLAVTAAFVALRAETLPYLVTSIFDAGRWPIRMFRGGVRVVFTYVFPLAVMTTFPADALLGTLPVSALLVSSVLAAGFFAASRALFFYCLRRYASASS